MDNHSGKGGGATELAKHLVQLGTSIKLDKDKEKIIIGIFDNDAKGFQEFNGIANNFVEII